MTDNMTRLCELAGRINPVDAIREEDTGFTLALPKATLSFFSIGGHSAAAYCRALVADLGESELPQSFAEAALRGNFFWRGTDGATLSFNQSGNSVWLTDRFDDGAFADEDAFSVYLEGFIRTLEDWKGRLAVCLPAETQKEVL